jgi:hypothetical protein
VRLLDPHGEDPMLVGEIDIVAIYIQDEGVRFHHIPVAIHEFDSGLSSWVPDLAP